MKRLKNLFYLFLIMFKIGLFTFGGGYAMIAIIERELVEKKNLLSHEEFINIIAIAESTPGPIAVNSATYIGYKKNGVLGSLFATLGVVLPSFIVIYIISLFFEQFLALEYVNYAFRGIQVCVAFLIISAGIKMLKKLKKSAFNIIMVIIFTLAFLAVELLAVSFSTIFFILIGALVGLVVYLIGYFKNTSKKEEK
ncbi:MAG: chromate transporter [Clostridia bacterium]|nr:chromate transporter [Clostridia bacterium]